MRSFLTFAPCRFGENGGRIKCDFVFGLFRDSVVKLRKSQTVLEQARKQLDFALRKKFFLAAKIGARRRAVG